jgi:16S rRNA (uracil1498-N3)-methyltransferase
MKHHHFFVEENLRKAESGIVKISDPEILHQWLRVLKLSPGSEVVLLDDSGFEFISSIETLGPGEAILKIKEVYENKHGSNQEVFLFQSLIKSDKFEWVLQKGTELGVARFMPILADHSEKKSLNFPRCKKILIEASEQCGRATLPKLYEVMKLEEAFGQYDARAVVFHPDAPKFNKLDFINEKNLAIFIGPEGGWSEREIDLFKKKNVPILSFSSLILRSETAAIAISSLILL